MSIRKWFALAGLALLIAFLYFPKNAEFAQQAEPSSLPPGLLAPSQPGTMPAFSLPGINRPALQSGELLGKVVVLRFWATH